MVSLQAKGAEVAYHDPHVPSFVHEEAGMTGIVDLDQELAASDCVVIATDHDAYDWGAIKHSAHIVVDTRRAVR